ncbi:MarR family winged helix-turn-helix transcriptional regulator [Lentzea guizhouensis]|uniref:MarR family winged helix-turn-helix transcriptional regulator n=1 Tax=Lentzea guizhouensis TaxID=1586287 RepID=UPI000A6C2208|nr:MarR family transcriptional regulator [Lentzea guizhouensis]
MTQDSEEPRWLTASQRLAWLDMVRVLTRLPATLEAQLERDAGLTFFEYHVLSMLSEIPSHTLRLSRLAQLTSSSLSRLSNVVKRLEGRGLLAREPDPHDRRASCAVLTEAGMAAVERAAPGHVAVVRELVVDPLEAEQLSQLHAAHERILSRLDPASSTRPEWLEG